MSNGITVCQRLIFVTNGVLHNTFQAMDISRTHATRILPVQLDQIGIDMWADSICRILEHQYSICQTLRTTDQL